MKLILVKNAFPGNLNRCLVLLPTASQRFDEIEETQARLRRNIRQSQELIDSAQKCLEKSRRVREPEHA